MSLVNKVECENSIVMRIVKTHFCEEVLYEEFNLFIVQLLLSLKKKTEYEYWNRFSKLLCETFG